MKRISLILLILFYAIIIHFWRINVTPPLMDSSLYSYRLISSVLSISSSLLLYYYFKKMFASSKIALLSSLFYTILPWTMEQGRIYSQVNNFLFICLLLLVINKMLNNTLFKTISFIIFPLSLLLFYREVWIIKVNRYSFHFNDFFQNIFFLTSTEFLFFKNPTFWWGGVRDFGVMLSSSFPIFLIGIYQLISFPKLEIFFWGVLIIIFSALSPFLPESREFFLITPFISLTLSLGLLKLFSQKKILYKAFFAGLFILIIYDLSQFLHYYFIHYPQQVSGNLSQIHEAF